MTRDIIQSSFLTGHNAIFLEQLYSAYVQNPNAVDPTWRQFFEGLGDGAEQILKQAVGASWSPRPELYMEPSPKQAVKAPAPKGVPSPGLIPEKALLDALRIQMLIRVYRVRGHLNAALDPLGIMERETHPELVPETYGFTADDYDHPIFLNGMLGKESATLRDVISILKRTYCHTIGVEFMHIQDPDQKDWIQRQVENATTSFSKEEKQEILEYLTRAEDFENFLSVKYPGAKRFGLEGGESLIPALNAILKDAAEAGVQDTVFGMAHRGRLNVLTNIIGVPCRSIFSEFQQKQTESVLDMQGSGDVKYHLGASNDRSFGNKKMHVSLTANPSHLEAVNPVVVGKVRAKQALLKDVLRNQVLGILIHGDAAFAGQGLVGETLGMSELRGYRSGGTIHVIINNQIGFTTSPHFSRSSPYCSDIAKAIQAPIFHVNGDDPEAVVRVAKMAFEFRALFKKDVVIDLYCYRRHGHNEMDDPSFTQPIMYQVIKDHPTTRTLYAQQLIQEQVIEPSLAESMVKGFNGILQSEFDAAKSYKPKKADWLEGLWAGFDHSVDLSAPVKTGLKKETFEKIAKALTRVPQNFVAHKRLLRLLDEKKTALVEGKNIDWATGEALAFGSLLLSGNPIRLSGQDSGRGTFSQRHAIIYDQNTGAPYIPLNNIESKQAEAEIIDSPLSEASVLGFELGYSLTAPKTLILWEAQFGDFANGAQVIIDQFISSGEAKWLRMSGLVMLLPHGYEGQGPEHSSARLERYLQLCAEDNMQVANCTLPANYFHILRRQLVRKTRKPLVMMTPKSLLRHKLAVSTTQDFLDSANFKPVIGETDPRITAKTVRRVVLCSGKIYFDLLEAREKAQLTDVALVRVEQLYPFPQAELVAELKKYNPADVIWCQEEPENMGAWNFIDRRLENALGQAKIKATRPIYAGRKASAATAAGSLTRHLHEHEELIKQALSSGKTKG